MVYEKEFIHIARLLSQRKYDDAALISKKILSKIIKERSEFASEAKSIINLMNEAYLLRAKNFEEAPVPVDLDSRLELLRKELKPSINENIIWPQNVQNELNSTINEREKSLELIENGLSPTKSLLFTGLPGVGKTMAAKWLAHKLNRPLLTLDLSAVMSSYLGRTGNNIRVVLDYARNFPCVLLLDEFDAIAKRRDDSGEIGELKRLVTVLLQEIDSWPTDGLLISATNHPELLDPAVWRRFDRVIDFPCPNQLEIIQLITKLLDKELSSENEKLIDLLAICYDGKSFSEVTRLINILRKNALINKCNIQDLIAKEIEQTISGLSREERIFVTYKLIDMGYSERKACEITGVVRGTFRNQKK
ncbi:ATP-binding protein [Vitreoscilla massiliensis]|uniref:ATP-binding protein n=1 Tax=Vitreoscilla massiliensis TaxID=1689272 RepID=A0ABY4E1I1_9NEIS|nr:ATP-binding protein [Vitreoscilla massiliensis]UOO89196.1 ATP-binding protein [Vitreoscilla massiliensis]